MNTDERRARAIWKYRWPTAGEPDPLKHASWVSCMEEARAIRASDEAAGMVLVPREPTQEMGNIGRHEIAMVADAGSFLIMATASWHAMIAAAEKNDDAE